jgi:hypothetical protein
MPLLAPAPTATFAALVATGRAAVALHYLPAKRQGCTRAQALAAVPAPLLPAVLAYLVALSNGVA